MNHNESINTRQGDGSLIASRCSRDSDDKSSLRGVLGTDPVTHSMILQIPNWRSNMISSYFVHSTVHQTKARSHPAPASEWGKTLSERAHGHDSVLKLATHMAPNP